MSKNEDWAWHWARTNVRQASGIQPAFDRTGIVARRSENWSIAAGFWSCCSVAVAQWRNLFLSSAQSAEPTTNRVRTLRLGEAMLTGRIYQYTDEQHFPERSLARRFDKFIPSWMWRVKKQERWCWTPHVRNEEGQFRPVSIQCLSCSTFMLAYVVPAENDPTCCDLHACGSEVNLSPVRRGRCFHSNVLSISLKSRQCSSWAAILMIR